MTLILFVMIWRLNNLIFESFKKSELNEKHPRNVFFFAAIMLILVMVMNPPVSTEFYTVCRT